MDFNTFRNCFSEANRGITLDQFRSLSLDELNALIRDANLSRPNAGQARLFYSGEEATRKRKLIDQLARIQVDCPDLYREHMTLLIDQRKCAAVLEENMALLEKTRILTEVVRIYAESGAVTILRSLYDIVIARFRNETWERAKWLYFVIFHAMPPEHDSVVLEHLPNDILLMQRKYKGYNGEEYDILPSYGPHCDDVVFMRSLRSLPDFESKSQKWRERFADHCKIASLSGYHSRRASDEDIREALRNIHSKLSDDIHQIGARFGSNGQFVLPGNDKYSEAEVFALATVVKEAGLDPVYQTGRRS